MKTFIFLNFGPMVIVGHELRYHPSFCFSIAEASSLQIFSSRGVRLIEFCFSLNNSIL